MKKHVVKVYPSKIPLPKTEQLAWKIAEMASDSVAVEKEVSDMVGNRMIDNAAVAIAAINRRPVASARTQALAHPRADGATLWGLPNSQRFDCEWAAWSNGTAVRELDMHDTFLAADYSHPADNIPPLLAVAQQKNCTGEDLVRGLATAYETQINLVKSICLHKHKIDHIAHIGPAVAAGIGTMLKLPTDTIYQAVQQAVHVCFTTRQSRKGEISSWKAYAPAHAGKLGIEAVDRAMRGEKAPSPIYEGEDSVIAWMLDGPQAEYHVPLPEKNEPKRAILDSYTKEHSAEYQAQALIDLAFKFKQVLATRHISEKDIESIVLHTSHHTHFVIGTGAGDPQKMDPRASRETLDHSIMYIFAVALQDGKWHHVDSYAPERAQRPDTVELWHKVSTVEDKEWTERYHDTDPARKAFGARVVIRLKNGQELVDEMAVANANPLGAKPFRRPDYIKKYKTLTEGVVLSTESDRFLSLIENLGQLKSGDALKLNVEIPLDKLVSAARNSLGIF